MLYVADFETSKENNKTWLWAWGITQIGNVQHFKHGNHLSDFLAWCEQGKENKTVYFHNLRFDGEFIFHYLLTNGFEYSEKKYDRTFNCIISQQGAFYKIEVIFRKIGKKFKKVTFLDSLKKLPMPVAKIGKAFGLPMSKGDIDHDIVRYPDHVITDVELDYLKRDVQVVAMALGIQMEQNLDRMTIGSDTMHDFKSGLAGGDIKKGKKLFERYFPVLPLDMDNQIRPAYRGGYTYANPKYIGEDIGSGIVMDINSMYPWAMRYKDLPYAMPIPFKGKYETDEQYPLYIQRIYCEFTLKKGYLPTIQIKNSNRYKATEYLTTNVDKMGNFEPTEITLTNVDLELFVTHYDVIIHEYVDGFKFKSCNGMFNRYIDHWMAIKEKATLEKNEGMRTLAKLMLNNLYGKFGTNPDVTGRFPELQDDSSIKLVDKDEEISKPVYTAMASFITSWCRDNIIRSAQSVYDQFLYADTDSLHLMGTVLPNLDIHPTRLGAWDHENTFKRARYLRAKTYIEEILKEDGSTKLDIKCAGMPDNVKKFVTWENFHPVKECMFMPARDGYYYGKLTPSHVEGGQILEPIYFTVKGGLLTEEEMNEDEVLFYGEL